MQLAKPLKTAMAIFEKLSVFTGPIFDNPTLYCNIVGSLQH